MKALLFAAALTFTAPAVLAQPTAEAEVAARIEAVAERARTQDVEGSVELFDPEVLLIHPRRGEVRYDQIVPAIRRGLSAGPADTRVAVDAVTVSGDLAVATMTWTTRLPDGSTRQERDMEVWRRTDGVWRLYRGASFPLTPAN